MAHLTIPQAIKISLGIFLFVVMIGGAYLFFKDTVIDFFKNLIGGEEEIPGEEISEEEEEEEEEEGIGEPSRFCEDCKKDWFDTCTEEECMDEISSELIRFNRKCRFTPKSWFGGTNKCITIGL